MKDPKIPNEFQNFDDIPGNTGWNYYPLDEDECDIEEEEIENDCE